MRIEHKETLFKDLIDRIYNGVQPSQGLDQKVRQEQQAGKSPGDPIKPA